MGSIAAIVLVIEIKNRYFRVVAADYRNQLERGVMLKVFDGRKNTLAYRETRGLQSMFLSYVPITVL